VEWAFDQEGLRQSWARTDGRTHSHPNCRCRGRQHPTLKYNGYRALIVGAVGGRDSTTFPDAVGRRTTSRVVAFAGSNRSSPPPAGKDNGATGQRSNRTCPAETRSRLQDRTAVPSPPVSAAERFPFPNEAHPGTTTALMHEGSSILNPTLLFSDHLGRSCND